jgi:hypothetical protein
MDPWGKYIAIFTGVLALATFALAWVTYRMAAVSRLSLALDSRPYLAFDGLQWLGSAPGVKELRPVLKLKNVSRVLINFQVDLFEVRANGLVPPLPAINQNRVAIFPGMQVEFDGPVIPGIDTKLYFSGHVHFRITYWSDPKGKRYLAEQEVDFEGNGARDWIRWKSAGTPNYT